MKKLFITACILITSLTSIAQWSNQSPFNFDRFGKPDNSYYFPQLAYLDSVLRTLNCLPVCDGGKGGGSCCDSDLLQYCEFVSGGSSDGGDTTICISISTIDFLILQEIRNITHNQEIEVGYLANIDATTTMYLPDLVPINDNLGTIVNNTNDIDRKIINGTSGYLHTMSVTASINFSIPDHSLIVGGYTSAYVPFTIANLPGIDVLEGALVLNKLTPKDVLAGTLGNYIFSTRLLTPTATGTIIYISDTP